MQILFLSLLFYSQNFLISLFIPFVFIPSLWEFLSILLIVVLIRKSSYFKILFILWQLLYFVQFSFISYFGSTLSYIDIYLFFTHIDETFQSLNSLYEIFLIPFTFLTTISIIILFSKQTNNYKIPFKIFIPLLFLSIYLIPKNHDGSLLLLEQLFKSYKIFQIKESKLEKSYHSTLNPIEKKDLNIILIIGESMRAKEFASSSYKIFENYTYKTIYSGATNTDVSIPLLLNGAQRPTQIDLNKNIFTLAKRNGFDTSFITSQSDQYLKYIKPYLQKDDIDNIKVLNSLDEKLFETLKAIDLNRPNFITLQMQGEHSPYIYYPNAKEDDSIKIRYQNSMKYSSEILTKIINYIKQHSQKPYIILFTSDHGEQIGINGKYGHNRFEEEVYKVPLVFDSNFIKMPNSILSHNDIYQLLLYHLGYSATLKFHRPINIYGTMITEEDGFIQIKP